MPYRRPGAPDLDLALGVWARRGRPWTSGRCPGVCGADTPRGTGAQRAPLWSPLEGTCGRAAPRELAESMGPSDSLFPSRAGVPAPGSPARVPVAAGTERNPAVRELGRRPGSALSPARAALLCLTSAKSFRTNSCCPNSDEPPVGWLRQDKGFPCLPRAGAGRLHAASGVKMCFPYLLPEVLAMVFLVL